MMIKLFQQLHVQQQQHMDCCEYDTVLEMLKYVEVILLSLLVTAWSDDENDGRVQMVLLDVDVPEDDGASKLGSMLLVVILVVVVQLETYLERHWDYVPR